jgi:methylated-DNA-[protein]-cysteine S-methyltransferase
MLPEPWKIELSHLESPLGDIVLAFSERGLCALQFEESEAQVRARLERSYPGAEFGKVRGAAEVVEKLRAYFSGAVQGLETIPVAPKGTPFQQRVWTALQTIPIGQTRSYLQIANAIGRPGAVRAVGAANGQNPIAVVVPCHRVIASNGTLCGYGGGLWRKKWLLEHERLHQAPPLSAAMTER